MIIIEVNKEQLKKLKNIYASSDSHAARQRAHAIMLLHLEKKKPEELAIIFDVSRITIYNWIHRWNNHGIDGIYDRKGRGSKPLFSLAEEAVILNALEKNPASLRQVAEHVEKVTGKKAHVETLRKIIRKHGKVWKRKRKSPKGKPDSEAYEQGKKDIQELQLLSSQGEFDLAYFDASGFSLQPVVPYAWQDQGRNGTLEIPSSHSKRVNLLGFLNPTKNELHARMIEGSVNSEKIIEVMDEYCNAITQPTVVILDNTPIHTSDAVKERIPEWEKCGLSLYFLPTYSPELNLIEILWRFIKYQWLSVSAYESFGKLKSALREIIDSYGSEYKIAFSSV